MPGNTFVSAHVNRLQRGYYQSDALHEGALNDVYFVSVHFVFHPQDHHYHRFRAATIKVSVHGDVHSSPKRPPRSHPRILKHAPELIYGAVSPENLQWNFNLSSSLGVTQAPISASLNPSGGVRKTYRVYDMMSIQGSLRVLRSPLGPEHDADDATAVWTLEENLTQRSGLPREFDFVMLVHKPDDVRGVALTVDLDATISSWHGDYPAWYTNRARFLPNVDSTLDMATEVGQKFLPETPGRGFNFAALPHALDQYVCMPGSMYPTTDAAEEARSGDQTWRRYRQYEPRGASSSNRVANAVPTSSPEPVSQPRRMFPDTLNLNVTLHHRPATSIGTPLSPSMHRSPASPTEPVRRHSIRRRRSRSELKAYGVQQALDALAGDVLEKEKERRVANRGSVRVEVG